jgi:hypothetical protein
MNATNAINASEASLTASPNEAWTIPRANAL